MTKSAKIAKASITTKAAEIRGQPPVWMKAASDLLSEVEATAKKIRAIMRDEDVSPEEVAGVAKTLENLSQEVFPVAEKCLEQGQFVRITGNSAFKQWSKIQQNCAQAGIPFKPLLDQGIESGAIKASWIPYLE